MNLSVFSQRSRVATRANALRLLAGLAAGALAGYAMGRFAKAMGAGRNVLGWSEQAALLLATLMLAAAAYVMVLAADRKRLARAIESGTETPASDTEVRQFRLQAAVLALAGLLFAGPILLAPLAKEHAALGPTVLAAALAGLISQSWLNWRVWRAGDEFVRRAFESAAAVAFVAAQAGLFAWAAAEKLVGAPPASSWDVLVALTGVYLVASARISLNAAHRDGALAMATSV